MTYWRSECGTVELHCGDCLALLPTLGEVDCVLTDPPYGMGLEYSRVNNRGTTRTRRTIDNDESVATRDAALGLIQARAMIVFGTWKTPKPDGTYAMLVWNKGAHVGMGDLSFPWKLTHEEVYFLGDKSIFAGHRDGSVLDFPALYPNLPAANLARGEAFEHPTQKPLALIEHLLEKCAGATVLDPFMGSGTTGVSCVRLGKHFIGIERDPAYFEIAKRRIQAELERFPLFKEEPKETQMELVG